MVIVENCCPLTTTRGVTGSADASVPMPEIPHPFSRYRAAAQSLFTVGCHIQSIATRWRWSVAELPRSNCKLLSYVFSGTNPAIAGPLTSSMAWDHVYEACTVSP